MTKKREVQRVVLAQRQEPVGRTPGQQALSRVESMLSPQTRELLRRQGFSVNELLPDKES